MSTLRTFNLQNPDSGTVNIEMDQGGNTLMTGIATVRGAAHFTSTSGSDAVGIGTDITAYKLDIRVTGAEAGLRVYNPDTSSNASGILRLGNDDNQNAAFLRLNGSNNTSAVGGAGSLVLGHGLSKDLHLSTAGVSRLRIASDGRITHTGKNGAAGGPAIDPYSSFVLNDAEARLQLCATDGGSNAAGLILSNASKHWIVHQRGPNASNRFDIGYVVDSSPTDINQQASRFLSITTAGLVGVNCTPLSQFQVKSGTNQNIALSSMSSEAAIEAYNDAGSANVPLRLRASAHKFFIGSTEGFRVHTNGLIGVGYDSPTAYGRMTVAMPSQSGGAAIQVANSSLGSGDGTTSNIVLRSVNNSGNNWADAEYRASQHIFAIQGSEKVRISSSGLAINKSSAADAEIEIVQSQDPTLRLYDYRNTAYKADFLMAGSAPVIRNNNTTVSNRTLSIQKGTTDQFIIEGNGAVRKPLSPAFQASLGGANLNAATHSSVIVFNNEHFDKSNSYDPSNGRFTAPVAGLYYFGVQIYAGFNISGVRVLHSQFQKNGSDVASADMFGGSSNHGGTYYHPTGCGHMLIELAVNDWVAFNSGGFSGSGSGSAFIYASSGTRFFGYLVG